MVRASYTWAAMRMSRLPLALALVLAAWPAPARAGAPIETLRTYTEQVLRVLDDPSLDGQDRRAAVRRIAIDIFDVTETARRALARHWHGRTPAEREEFVRLFADLLERTYIGRIDQYGGERLRFTGEVVDGKVAVVRALVVTRRGTEVPVESRMHRVGDRWLMYDVLIENVSLVANYRSQFDRIIRTSSFDELLRRLRERSEEAADRRAASGRSPR